MFTGCASKSADFANKSKQDSTICCFLSALGTLFTLTPVLLSIIYHKFLFRAYEEVTIEISISRITHVSSALTAATNTDKEKKENWPKVVDHLSKNTDYDYVLAAEGEFVLRFNRQFDNFIKNKMTKQSLTELKKELKNSLNIPLTKKGFVNAALRDTNGENDTTNYDAIWVRDSAWIYFSMIHGYKDSVKARTIMLALWDYYSSAEQLARFDAVTKNPKLALDSMAVPHIRFDGNSKILATSW